MDDRSFYGDGLAVPEEDVVFFHQTSGTTSRPQRQPDTLEDWYWWGECWASVLWAQGVRNTDRVLIGFNYNLFIGFWGAHYGCEKIGAEILSTGGLSTEQRLDKLMELKITTIVTTPTYAFRLMEGAARRNIDLKTLGIKRIICAGEPGALIPETKKELEQAWGCDVFDHIGATEVGAWGYECSSKSGGLHINESMFLVELLDMETKEVITEPNKYGIVVITSLDRKGKPCIRFNTNDIACWQETSCECGRTYRLLKGGISGRVDHLIKARGTFITPAVIENIIMAKPYLTNEFFIQISKKSTEISVHIEIQQDINGLDVEKIKEELEDEIYKKTSLRFKVVLEQYGKLARSDTKSRRLIDLRKES
ncbi:phenylacetate--CoA ligase family protein [Cellulosilyticum ruminicola]|uniref:phenylacetate--CoA ligase family protein n=1 Tax=Cellulosilyticum ruminicola TaxID=425254 RepID=UPI0006D16AAB|nr:AMP-binding protein [Cellulosilyticum ruminicola]